ncbi:hypothetical protein DM02DRAFT_725586 [Periconia macrospinosa]|uniref:Uncharacterized protein n=1 Tax=Periconia macrospinosa TaxID=97972 RepID=A0A2V1E268_9PLEO|nr:hypothetical protein DM02DRAFT_725586 [Periconia macrospinosa]
MANNFRKEIPDRSLPTSGYTLNGGICHEQSTQLDSSIPYPTHTGNTNFANFESSRPNFLEQTTSPRPKVLTPGSIAPEFAHLVHNDLPISSPLAYARTNENSSVYSPSGSHQSDHLNPNNHGSIEFVPTGNGHPREKMRSGTPYPPKDRSSMSTIKDWNSLEGENSRHAHTPGDETVASAEGVAETLRNVQLDGKPKLIYIGRAAQPSPEATSGTQSTSDSVVTASSAHRQPGDNSEQFDLQEVVTTDGSKKSKRYSIPFIPGAWPETPPLEPPSQMITMPSQSQDVMQERHRLLFLADGEIVGFLGSLPIAHIIYNYGRQDSKLDVNQANQDEGPHNSCTPSNTGENSCSPLMRGEYNRVSVNTEFAKNYYTNPLETLQNGEGRAHITEGHQTQYRPYIQHCVIMSNNPWAEKISNSPSVRISQIHQNASIIDKNIEGRADSVGGSQSSSCDQEDYKRLWNEFLEKHPNIETTMSPRTPSPILATQDMPGLMATANTPASASLSTTHSLHSNIESEHLPSHGFFSHHIPSPIEPPQETPDLRPSLPSNPHEFRGIPLPPFTPRPTPPNPANAPPYHHSNYSVPYSISTRATISVPATSNPPSPRVGVFNTSDAILRTASGRTYLMPERHDPVDLTPLLRQSRRMEETAHGLQTEDQAKQTPRRSSRNPFRLTEAQEDLRRALIQRSFRRNQSSSLDSLSSTPTHNTITPQTTARPTRQNTHSPDPHFGFPLHPFPRPYGTFNPYNLPPTPSSDWVDTDSNTTDFNQPLPAALVGADVQEEQGTSEMQERPTSSSNAVKRHLLSLYHNLHTVQNAVQQKWAAAKHKPRAFFRRVRGARSRRTHSPFTLSKTKHRVTMTRLTRHVSVASDCASLSGSAVRPQWQRRGGSRRGAWRRYLRVPSRLVKAGKKERGSLGVVKVPKDGGAWKRKWKSQRKAMRKFVTRILVKMDKIIENIT